MNWKFDASSTELAFLSEVCGIENPIQIILKIT